MPRNLISLESKFRETINSKISRGKVDVFVTQNSYENEDREIRFNEEIADSYFECLKTIKNRYEVRDDISVSLIAKFPDVINMEKKEEDLEEIWKELQKPLVKAVEGLVEMREREGKKLYEDIIIKCNTIKELVDKLEERSPNIVKEHKEKLENRIDELLENSSIDENRLAAEVALFADKASIDEEIVRLNSHVVQLKETLEKNDPVGRKLDFIVQEMNR